MNKNFIFLSLFLLILGSCKLENLHDGAEVAPAPACNVAATFSIVNNACKWPCSITFNNESLNASAYIWDFGDSTTSTQAIPTHEYEKPGVYQVQLTAIGDCEDSTSKSVGVAFFTFEKTFGKSPNTGNRGESGTQTSDGGYIIIGSTSAQNYDIYLVKADENGSLEWEKSFVGPGGPADDFGYSVIEDRFGGYMIAASTTLQGTTTGNSNGYLIKTREDGDTEWTKVLGNIEDDDRPYSVIQNADRYVTTGFIQLDGSNFPKASLSACDYYQGFVIPELETFGGKGAAVGTSVIPTADGGYMMVGYTYDSLTSFQDDVYQVKTDENLNLQWEKYFGGPGLQIGNSVIQTADGGYLIVGYSQDSENSPFDIYLIKTDALGIEEWDKTFGGPNNEIGYSVIQTTDGGYMVAGSTRSPQNGNPDVYLLKTDASGMEEWNKTFGETQDSDEAFSLSQTTDGGYMITGTTTRPQGSYVYLIKTDDQGNVE